VPRLKQSIHCFYIIFSIRIVHKHKAGHSDGALVRELHFKTLGCGFESSSNMWLWDVFPRKLHIDYMSHVSPALRLNNSSQILNMKKNYESIFSNYVVAMQPLKIDWTAP